MSKVTINSDALIIGGGVIGLAIAKELSSKMKTIVVEKEKLCGEGISSRNSGVIHSGIYYEKDSLKSKFCLNGNKLLYNYASEKNIPHKQTGKLIVASHEEELEKLEKIFINGGENGLEDLLLLSGNEIQDYQKEIKAIKAIFVPSTGIIDVKSLIDCLYDEIISNGSFVTERTKVEEIDLDSQKFITKVKSENDVFQISSSYLVNCAGLEAVSVARLINNFPKKYLPAEYFAKGHYFRLSGRHPFNGPLVYPINPEHGLGIHLTLDLDGNAKFGPDIVWTKDIDFSFRDANKDKFVKSIQSYWENLDPSKLNEDYCGIRPKISGPNEAQKDFLLQGPDLNGIFGLYNLFGFESPGLTSCLSIANYIQENISENLP